MKFYAHDSYRSFDYVQTVNRVFDLMVANDMDYQKLAEATGLSAVVISKFFRYQAVSLPTLLLLAKWASVNLEHYVIHLDE